MSQDDMQTAHQLINQTSTEVEYYTPQAIIEAARNVLGEIDLDPASSPTANDRVNAASIYTEQNDGMAQEWFGRVWMNHPFGRAEDVCGPRCMKEVCSKRGWHRKFRSWGNAAWVAKFVGDYENGQISAGCCITFASTSEGWFQPLLNFPQCFLAPRTNYYLPNGKILKGVSKGSVVTYLGPDVQSFWRNFSSLGKVKVSYETFCLAK